MRGTHLCRLAVWGLALLVGARLCAQYTLNGRAQDGATGLAEVLVAITNLETGFILTNRTETNGNFGFVNLPAGNYTVGAFKARVEFDPPRYDIFLPTNTTTLIFQVVCQHLAAIGTDGTLQSWNPGASGSVDVVDVLAVSDGTVYVGGWFSSVGGEPRDDLAAVGTDGTLQSWNPGASRSAHVLAVSDATVYAGGYFVTVGGQLRGGLVLIDATTRTLID